MRFYATQYAVKDPLNPTREVIFGSAIYAASFAHACNLAMLRNIGEIVHGLVKKSDHDPCPLPSSFYQARKMIECVHSLTFYGWIASMSKVMDLRVLCSDLGLIHEVLHEMHHPEQYSFRPELHHQMLALEASIPGLKSYANPSIKSKKITVK